MTYMALQQTKFRRKEGSRDEVGAIRKMAKRALILAITVIVASLFKFALKDSGYNISKYEDVMLYMATYLCLSEILKDNQ